MNKGIMLKLVFLVLLLGAVATVIFVTMRGLTPSAPMPGKGRTLFEQFVTSGGWIVWFILLPMSFATVYSTLETLKQRGMLAELTIDPAKKRFDPNTEKHHHLICTGCRKVVDVRRDFCLDLPAGVADGFEVTGNHIEFYGTCPACGTK